MKMQIVVDGENTKCFLSDSGLKKGAGKILEGKTLLDLFPKANKPDSFMATALDGVDASIVPIIVLSSKDFDERFASKLHEEHVCEF